MFSSTDRAMRVRLLQQVDASASLCQGPPRPHPSPRHPSLRQVVKPRDPRDLYHGHHTGEGPGKLSGGGAGPGAPCSLRMLQTPSLRSFRVGHSFSCQSPDSWSYRLLTSRLEGPLEPERTSDSQVPGTNSCPTVKYTSLLRTPHTHTHPDLPFIPMCLYRPDQVQVNRGQREGGGVTKAVCVTVWAKLEKCTLGAIHQIEFTPHSTVVSDKTTHLPTGFRNDPQL